MSAVESFDEWNPSSATPMEEVCGLQGGILQNNSYLVTFQRVSWSAHEPFSGTANIYGW